MNEIIRLTYLALEDAASDGITSAQLNIEVGGIIGGNLTRPNLERKIRKARQVIDETHESIISQGGRYYLLKHATDEQAKEYHARQEAAVKSQAIRQRRLTKRMQQRGIIPLEEEKEQE